jgi:hypothetical protein
MVGVPCPELGGEGMDRVWQYAGTFIVTVVGWILWCIFTQRGSFVPTVDVMVFSIGALTFDLWRNTGPLK